MMELENLKRTLSLCIKYHDDRGDKIKVQQLEQKWTEADSKRLEDLKGLNGIYIT